MLDAAIFSLPWLLGSLGPSCLCPCATPQSDGPGLATLIVRPSGEAYALNRQGRDLYRRRRFAEARVRYQGALETDPRFVAPRLNISCALVQEGNLEAGVDEALALAQRAYVPWGHEIERAADLAPLRAHPALWGRLSVGLERAAAAWAAPLGEAVFFVARTGRPVKLPASGVLHLGLEQEIFAWLPGSGTYRQVTAEDGRVLAFAVAPNRRTMVYLRSGKLVREAGKAPRLRAVSVRHLDLETLATTDPAPLPGDYQTVGVAWGGKKAGFLLQVEAPSGRHQIYRVGPSGATPVDDPAGSSAGIPALVTLTAEAGVAAARAHQARAPCRFRIEERRPAAGASHLMVIQRRAPRSPFALQTPHGAGLFGLPWPE